jgi:hypothetical protein
LNPYIVSKNVDDKQNNKGTSKQKKKTIRKWIAFLWSDFI